VTRPHSIDWPKVLDDMAHLLGEVDGQGRRWPCSQERLAERLGIARGTLRGWMDGSEPRHCDGEELLDRWCRLTGRGRVWAPKARRSLPATAR
jgi:hypothetical protein